MCLRWDVYIPSHPQSINLPSRSKYAWEFWREREEKIKRFHLVTIFHTAPNIHHSLLFPNHSPSLARSFECQANAEELFKLLFSQGVCVYEWSGRWVSKFVFTNEFFHSLQPLCEAKISTLRKVHESSLKISFLMQKICLSKIYNDPQPPLPPPPR